MSPVTCHMSITPNTIKKIAISPFFDASGNKNYRCYNSHRSRDSLSPVCEIFVLDFKVLVGKIVFANSH